MLTKSCHVYLQSGTRIDSETPCIKTVFFFNPRHKLETVVASMQDENEREVWDTNIESMEILDQSDTRRLKVVHTTYKPLASQGRREFVDKKLSFSVRNPKNTAKNKSMN